MTRRSSFFSDFKAFIQQGNVVDLAVTAPDPQAQLAAAATRLADALDRRQL